jgi:hypothetical protein
MDYDMSMKTLPIAEAKNLMKNGKNQKKGN